jgi:hypothetical protein
LNSLSEKKIDLVCRLVIRDAKRMSACLLIVVTYVQAHSQDAGCLHRFEDEVKNTTGYISEKGDTVIRGGIYANCFTEKFCRFAIVATQDGDIIGINRKKEMLYHVFVFDNGPDELSNGLFRIKKDGKTGYADANGHIVIQPQYDCAEKFYKGIARVGIGCKMETIGEHSTWKGGHWFYINTKGIRVISKKG